MFSMGPQELIVIMFGMLPAIAGIIAVLSLKRISRAQESVAGRLKEISEILKNR